MTENPTPDPGGPVIPSEITALWGKGDKGDKGDRGPKGDKGDKGIKGEAALIPMAQEMVTKLVKADRRRKWQVRVLGIVAVVATVAAALSIKGYFDNRDSTMQNSAYTNSVVQHECKALEDLTKVPVTKPADPAKNPSRVATYNFYEALLYWEHSDGCKS